MENKLLKFLTEFKTPITIGEAIKTECQTDGAIYDTKISNEDIKISIKIATVIELV